jgi:hypothetical protein
VITRALRFPRLVFGLYLVIFFTGADAPPKRAKPVAEHLFFRCKLLINPSYLKGLPIGTNRGI